LVDVDPDAVPAIDAARLVAMRKSAALKPSINAVRSPKPRLEPVWLAACERPLKDLDGMRTIFGVNDGVVCRPVIQLIQRLAEVSGDLGTDHLVLAVRRHEEDDDSGDTADDPARISLALT